MGCNQPKAANAYPQNAQEKAAMAQPFAVDKCPKQVQLQVGKEYYYCTCGLSKNQPFCDGSHTGTKFTPLKFQAKANDNHICMCRRSKNQPYCDGSHNSLDF